MSPLQLQMQFFQLKISTKQVFQQGEIKSDKELKKKQNETLTRKKQADLQEKINNVKIDQKKLFEKKSILTPKFKDISSEYFAQIEGTKIQMREFRSRYCGYIRQIYVERKRPDPTHYEADEIDIKFLKYSLRKIPKEITSQKEIINNPILKQFQHCIQILDRFENQQSLEKNLKQPHNFSQSDFDAIYKHWLSKCKKFKRPLLRINWKDILYNNKYGNYDQLKKAFFPGELNKEKGQRKVNKMSKKEVLETLLNIYTENTQGLILARFLRKREEMKYLQIMIQVDKETSKEYQIQLKKILDETRKLEKFSNKKFSFQPLKPPVKVQVPPTTKAPQKEQPKIVSTQVVVPPKQIVIQPQIDPDSQYLMASIVSALKRNGFSTGDFYSSKIDQINHKIKNANSKQKILMSNSQKEVDMSLASKQLRIKSPSSIFLVKKQSIIIPSENFIVKLTKEEIAKGKYDIANFTFDNIVNKYYQQQIHKYSHEKMIGYIIQNPYVYCSQSNLSFADNYTEILKTKIYNKLLDGIDMELIDQNPLDKNTKYLNMEKAAEEKLNYFSFNQKFKDFKKNKKRV